MLRLLLVGSVGSAALIAALAWGVYLGAVRDWDPSRAYSGSLEDQRHLAECYRSGCPRVKPSALYACAWREIIVEETAGQSAADVDAAEHVCR
jgi:hypothetical protein